MSAPVKVALVAPTQGVYGGIEAFALALGKALVEGGGFEPRLCFKLVRGFAFGADLGGRCRESGIPFGAVRRASPALFRAIARADVVHANNVSPDVVLMAVLLRKPVLLTVHNWCRETPRAAAWGRRVASALADVRTYNSRFVWGTWEPGRKRRGSTCLPTVSDLPDPAAFRVEPRRRRGFFFISRWIANKGVEVLLEAYRQARLDPVEWPLVMAGQGPLLPWGRDFVARHDLRGVEVLGFISEEEKHRRMASARWLVAPPHTREDLGLTPIEARHLGVPAIVTRDGGLTEAAGAAALVCQPGDVEGLAKLLRRAAAMGLGEYQGAVGRAAANLDPAGWLGVYAAVLRDLGRGGRAPYLGAPETS